jgi:hypothetical protein
MYVGVDVDAEDAIAECSRRGWNVLVHDATATNHPSQRSLPNTGQPSSQTSIRHIAIQPIVSIYAVYRLSWNPPRSEGQDIRQASRESASVEHLVGSQTVE